MGVKVVLPESVTTAGSDVPASSYDLGQKIKAAIAVGAFAAVGLTVLAWSALAVITELWVKVPWRVWLVAAGVALVIGTLAACWQGYGWVTQVAKRAWDVDDDERAYRRGLEREERRRQKLAALAAKSRILKEGDEDGDPATLSDQQRFDLVAQEMLERHYVSGEKATREAMEQAGACTQFEWNLVNRGMVALGLKRGYSWQAPDFATAWETWDERTKVSDDYLWVLRSNGSWRDVGRIK